jgi:hypothetical protein
VAWVGVKLGYRLGMTSGSCRFDGMYFGRRHICHSGLISPRSQPSSSKVPPSFELYTISHYYITQGSQMARLELAALVNMAWMHGALLAASMAAWLHQLTTATRGETITEGHGTRGGKAMIATLRRRLIAVPARLVRHAGTLILRLPPGHSLLAEVLARLRALPAIP